MMVLEYEVILIFRSELIKIKLYVLIVLSQNAIFKIFIKLDLIYKL